MRVGASKRVFGFKHGTPLAGYVTRKERLAVKTLDDLHVRAFAFSDNGNNIVVCCLDLLVMTFELFQAIKAKTENHLPEDAVLFITCSHTHSSAGGYWDHRVARWFMGKFRQSVFDTIADATARAIIESWKDLEPATIAVGQTNIFGMNHSRRIPDAEVDNKLTLVRIDGPSGPKAVLARFSAHPVIAAEKDFYAFSADFPGYLCAKLEQQIPIAGFVQGVLGGVGPVWPDHIHDAKNHLNFMVQPMAEKAIRLFNSLKPGPVSFSCGAKLIRQPPAGAQPFPKDWKLVPFILRPLVKLWDKAFDQKYAGRDIYLYGMRINKWGLLGFPADLGNGLAEAIIFNAKQLGYNLCDCCSQTGDYIGYVHSERDMDALSSWGATDMGMYENFMGFHGKNTGERFVIFARMLLKNMLEE